LTEPEPVGHDTLGANTRPAKHQLEMNMQKLILAVGLVVAQAATVGALAQTEQKAPKGGLVGDVKPAPTPGAMSNESRSQVRSEAKAANRSASAPKGGLVGDTSPAPTPGAMSNEPRSEVKSEAKAANQAGAATKGGLVGETKPAPAK
jgi:transglutaminase/protease-like cytokinesis protein 3